MIENKKICLITEYFPPETGAGSIRAFEHAKEWVKLGIEVEVITCMPHYPTGVIPEKYRNKFYYFEKIEGVSIHRTYTYAAASRGFLKRFIAYSAFMLSSIIQGSFLLKQVDFIIATSPPFSIGISGWVLSKLKRIPLVFEVRDLWPESLIQLGQVKNKILISLLEFIEKKIYQKAYYIVSVTDSYCDIIRQKNITKDKIKVIKNGVDTDFFRPSKKDIGLLNQHNLAEKRVIAYFGNFGLSQPIDRIVDLASIFTDKSEVHFILIGDGEQRILVENKIKEMNLTNITLLKTVSKSKLIKYYSIADLMIVPLKPIPLFKTVIPSKIFEIMAMGIPILLGVEGEARQLIEVSKAGRYIDLKDLKNVKNVICDLLSDNAGLEYYSKNGRRFVVENFDRKRQAKMYIELLFE
ncbi:MAG: glycosyltransferase family 4 protein [Melioribacteraceae bacterium]|nr:glycosyltransferase family 4 protein [Melioribacteraceae bacterium]MCF8354536.1 glycosyltransferase family 4 protein [Melioribacteraceae bacterium]MCF8393832.1 glycosyltransferase family 4 protein [Melioribacteraceae bacterium]MCF8418205.1 glycosyltransferase family 4 protein [Melioribacteraceae bacterium]